MARCDSIFCVAGPRIPTILREGYENCRWDDAAPGGVPSLAIPDECLGFHCFLEPAPAIHSSSHRFDTSVDRLHMTHSKSLVVTSRLSLALGFAMLAASHSSAQTHSWVRDWGNDSAGQVSSTPTEAEFTQVAAGTHHSLALRADGSLASWGVEGPPSNDYGQVSGTPTGTGFTYVAAGQYHSLALRSDGSIAAWGLDSLGQVGNAPIGTGFIQVDAGIFHSIALRGDGSIVSWGVNNGGGVDFGQVTSTPLGTGFTQVAAGMHHSLALRSDGSIVSWGRDTSGVVSNTPTGTGYVQLSGGTTLSVALNGSGTIAAWGNDSFGEVSNAPSGSGFTQVAAGANHALALHADGSVAAWGRDHQGQVSGTPSWPSFAAIQIAAGENHSAAIHTNVGQPFCGGVVCPCSTGGSPNVGCTNSAGAGALLVGTGHASMAFDSFGLRISGLPSSSPGLILRGSLPLNGGAGTAVGDGLLCTGSQTARSQMQVATSGVLTFTDFQGGAFGASSYGVGTANIYQLWYRDPQNTCSGAGFNFSNALFVTWLP